VSRCNKNLSPLQRRSLQLLGGCIGLIVFLTVCVRWEIESGHAPTLVLELVSLMPAIPVALMMIVAGRYLARETDEFVRMTVMQALLWGFGITLVTDVGLGGLSAYVSPVGPLIPILSVDLFIITAAIALRVQLWKIR
jgi:hypothetical protein